MELGVGVGPQIGDKTRVMLRLGWGCFRVGGIKGCPYLLGLGLLHKSDPHTALKVWWFLISSPIAHGPVGLVRMGTAFSSSHSSCCCLWGMSCHPQKLPWTQPPSDNSGYKVTCSQGLTLPGLFLIESNSVFSRLPILPINPIPEAHSLNDNTVPFWIHQLLLPAWDLNRERPLVGILKGNALSLPKSTREWYNKYCTSHKTL